MVMTSGISWCYDTWNPFVGCQQCADECLHCYIERELRKQKDWQSPLDHKPFRQPWGQVYLTQTWRDPYKHQRELDGTNLCRRLFTCSLSDFFIALADKRTVADAEGKVLAMHQEPAGRCGSNMWRDCAWQVIRDTPQCIYLILTKRPENILSRLPKDWGVGYKNVWIGTSVGCNRTLSKVDSLRKVPVHPEAVRFVSCEPLIEDISENINIDGIGWLICGGESGNNPEYLWDADKHDWRKMLDIDGRRTMKVEWAKKLRRLAYREGIPYWFKQVTSHQPGQGEDALGKICQEVPSPPKGYRWDEKAKESQPAVHVLSTPQASAGAPEPKSEPQPVESNPEPKIAATAKEAVANPEPPSEPQALGNCELCGDNEPVPAVEMYRSLDDQYHETPLCKDCADSFRKYDGKRLKRLMSVPGICKETWSWKSLLDEPKEVDDGNGGKFVLPNKPGYVQAVKEQFFGNAKYDQTIVKAYIARLEDKLKRHLAIEDVAKQLEPSAVGPEPTPHSIRNKPLDSFQPFETVPWQFLDELIALYCDKPEPDILDPTCNKRRMWGKSEHLKSEKFITMDLNPDVNPDVVGDNTNTPFDDNSFDLIVYDPPHTGDQRKSKTDFASKYGIGISTKNPETGKWGNLFHTYEPFLKEAKRILRSEAILLVKLADVTHCAKFQFATAEFYSVAEKFDFELLGKYVLPRKGVIIDPKWKKASHPRQNHCTWMAFKVHKDEPKATELAKSTDGVIQ
jgi:protein gp37